MLLYIISGNREVISDKKGPGRVEVEQKEDFRRKVSG